MKLKPNKSYKSVLTVIIITILLMNILAINLSSKSNLTVESKDEIYDLLIISPPIFKNGLEPLVCHKNKLGVKTKLVDTEEIYDRIYWQGRDKAEKIKYFIKEAHEMWGVKYVLLAGGLKGQSREKWWVPVRYSYLNRGYIRENGVLIPEQKFLCDLYFADIYDENGDFSSWDTNDNGIFGEWPINESAVDVYDLHPDVYVGRLPFRNVLDVFFVVRKIIKYETGEKPDSWFKKMVVVAGDTYTKHTDYYDGEVYTQMGLDMMSDFEPVKVWASEGTLTDWKSVVKPYNEGCGFIWFSGHGGPGTWSTHPPDDGSKWIGSFSNKDMIFLRNGEKLPVCVSGSGCFVSMFNISLLNYVHVYGLPITKCWSWTQVRKVNGGSIGTIGSTGFSYETPDINLGFGGCEQLDLAFFYEYGVNNTEILGECWGKAVTYFLSNFTIDWEDDSFDGYAMAVKNAEQWLLIGDPSLKIGGYPDS